MNGLLAIEREHHGLCSAALDLRTTEERLQEITAEARETLSGLPDDVNEEAKVQAVSQIVLLGREGVRPSQDLHDPCNLLPSGVLARHQGYCIGAAAVYLSIAEELGLPVYAVATPSHVFLRYDDGKTRINIATADGTGVPDEQYIAQARIAPDSVRRGVFLRNLSAERFLAQVHNNLGVIYSERKEFTRAAIEYQAALDLDDRLPAAWYNLGKDLQQQGELKKAVRAFSKSIRLHPNDAWAYNNRAVAYLDLGEVDRARSDLEMALAIDPALKQAETNRNRLPPQ